MFNFKPLWKTLIDKEMNKTELAKEIGASPRTIATMAKNGYISMETLDKICTKLNCKIEDVIEHIKTN